MALPGSAPSARPGLEVRGQSCLCRAQGPPASRSGWVPARPAHAGTSHRPHHTRVTQSPLSALRRATAPSQVCAVSVCVCARTLTPTHTRCTHMHAHVRAHAHHTRLHTLTPAPQVCICTLASQGAAEAEEEEGLATEGGSNLVVQPVATNPPCNARDTSSIPGLGKSHIPQSN